MCECEISAHEVRTGHSAWTKAPGVWARCHVHDRPVKWPDPLLRKPKITFQPRRGNFNPSITPVTGTSPQELPLSILTRPGMASDKRSVSKQVETVASVRLILQTLVHLEYFASQLTLPRTRHASGKATRSPSTDYMGSPGFEAENAMSAE